MMTEYGGGDNNHRISDWEIGLPSSDGLTPLSHRLISPELASAFSISPETHRTFSDVGFASENTLSCLRGNKVSETETEEEPQRGMNGDDVARGTKRARRLVWTPQLHKRFVEVVSHLGVQNAVPKTIMQMMNVEGLTRENVASHLQKYRLYLKRMQGLSDEGPSSSDHLFASSPIPQDPDSGNAIMHHVPVPLMPGHGPYQWMQPQMEGSGNYKFGFVG